jgi:hypothetical protein
MKKIYLDTITLVISIAIGVTILFYLLKDNSVKRDTSDVYLDDEEYLIYPSDSTDKWNIVFPSGDEYKDLKPEQLALFLKSGEIPNDTTWVIYPQCEYQLTLEDTTIVIEDFGRPVLEIPINKSGIIGTTLLKDNE